MQRLFPDEDYRPRMGLLRGSIEAFFAPSGADARLLAERRASLASHAARNVAFLPGAEASITEAFDLLARHGAPALGLERDVGRGLLGAGETLAPDLLFLAPRAEGLVLVAGVVCFPSSWSLAEKLGRPVEVIHAPVPGLEAQLGPAIGRFLARLPPGHAYLRSNFGLSASPDRDQHPARGLPRLAPGTALDAVHVRIEDQAFVALPATSGVLFGIRIRTFPVTALEGDRPALEGLRRALATMPPAMAAYKGLAEARPTILEALEDLLRLA